MLAITIIRFSLKNSPVKKVLSLYFTVSSIECASSTCSPLLNTLHTASSTPTQFNATYKSLTNIVLEWTYDIRISTGYNYIVYYQQSETEGDGHFNVSFNLNKNADNLYKYSLTVHNVYGIAIVATRVLSPSLPSPVVGPIIPGKCTIHYGRLGCTYFHTAVEAPSVSLSESGSRVAGNVYTLTCRVTLPEEVQSDYPPTIQWQTPQSASYTEAVSTTSGCSCISTITLHSLQDTDEGDYVCTASYVVGVFETPTVTATINVTVLREYKVMTLSIMTNSNVIYPIQHRSLLQQSQ